MATEGVDDISGGDNAEDSTCLVENGKFVLGSPQNGFGCVIEGCVDGERSQVGDHCLGNGQVEGDILHPGKSGFLRGAQVNEKGDEQEHWIAEESNQAK